MNNKVQATFENDQNTKKTSKTQNKIDRKLAQLTQQYNESLKKNLDQPYSCQLSRNKQQEKQRLQLFDECQSLQNFREIQPELIMNLVQRYNQLFVSNSIQKRIGDKFIEINDIKLKTYNEQEDQLFATHQLVHNTFRRGLCICGQDGKYRILRKGLKKFFDFTPECFKIKQSLIKQTLHDYAFKDLPQDKKIQITVMEKINGENAQISYDLELNQWIIGSKNVTILCGQSNDLINYQDDDSEKNRFRYAVKIAQQWFKVFLQSEEQEQIKQLLSSYTLIGEYCGNDEYQHLVKYEEVDLIFYSLVPKDNMPNSSHTCLHPILVFKKLQKLKLKCAKAESFTAESFEGLQKLLNDIATKIAKSSVLEEGEGSVIYISELCDQENKPTYSLLKIKTLDYRLKRKIREKLKGLIIKNQNINQLLEKYEQEAQSLLQQINIGLSEPIVVDLQVNLAKKCFEAINLERCVRDEAFKQFCCNFINNKFVKFLELLENQTNTQLENLYEIA